ncbi:MAG TPA: AraC family transcriptional regulator, partial [Negativicutes bacterium]|nr:AraC family transcriptional regulator [Negativicutes bacterium]
MERGQGTITLKRVKEVHNLELVRATDVAHALPRHIHETLCVAVVDSGARECRYKGSRHVINPGQVQVVMPGETHTCGSAGERYSYRVICLAEEAVAAVTSAVLPKSADVYFPCQVIDDVELCRLFSAAHDALAGAGGTLEKEAALHRPFARLAGYAPGPHAAPSRRGGEHRAVNLIRDYLAEHYEDDVSINDLALTTGLSPYHLIHVFTAAVGMSPHAFLNQVRVTRAKELLAAGGGLADAALAVGFADQSHFQRW